MAELQQPPEPELPQLYVASETQICLTDEEPSPGVPPPHAPPASPPPSSPASPETYVL